MTVDIFLKRNETPSKRPLASAIDFGEVCLNYDPESGGLFYKASNGVTVVKVGPCEVSDTQPNTFAAGEPGNSPGEFWYDTNTSLLKVYNGTSWVATGAGVFVGGVAPISVDNTDPLNPVVSISTASTTAAGAVQLTNDLTGTSESLALTGLAGKILNEAIGAVQAIADTNTANVGPLSSLQTSDKSSIVNAINEQELRLDLLGNSLIYGGTFNALTGQVASITQAGQDAGLVVGQNLPVGVATTNVFVIITVEGTGVPPAPPLLLEIGNWLVSNGSQWDYLQLGVPATTADLVAFVPTGEISATNVQAALAEVDTEKVSKTTQVLAGNGLTGGGNLSSNVTLSLPSTGVTTGAYGADGQYARVQVDTYGRITNATQIAATLGAISDVDLTTDPPVNLDLLQYISADNEWQPKTTREAGIPTIAEVNATENKIAYVDKATGNDATAIFGDITRPYSTIKAALVTATANAPSVVMVSEGTYNEVNPLIVPAGVQIVGKTGTLGWVATEIIPTVLTDDLILMTGNGAGVTGVTVTVPLSANKGAIVYDGPNGTTGSVTFTGIRGQAGSLASGIYCRCATTGKIISFENRYRGGDMDSLLRVDGGILANESTHVPNTPVGGGPRVVFLQKNNLGAPISRLQAASSNSGNSNVQHVFETEGGTAVFFSVNWFQAANGVHITSNSYNVRILGGLIDCVNSVTVDGGLTGSSGVLKIYAEMNDVFNYPFTWSDSDYTFEYNTKATDDASKGSAKTLHGSDFIIGENHRGNGLSVGRGGPTKGDLKVLTSDATASATTDGTNITDVSADAISKSGNPFTFQGTAANHCIYFGTTEDDETGTPLKHTGLDLIVSTGDLVGTYVVEIWSGTAWVQVGVQAVSSKEGYSYGNNLFWRSNSEENLFYGIRSSTTWAVKSIGGFSCYWSRIRIVTPPTTVPSILTSWLLPTASLNVSSEGVLSKMGFSQYGVVNAQGSNIFTESGTLVDYSFTMGPGGGNSYVHTIANVQISSNGEGLYWQTAIVPGICTALPIFIDVGYSIDGNTAPGFNLYLTPIETSGTLIGDPTGGLTPIPRPQSLTTPFSGAGSNQPTVTSQTLPSTDTNKLHRVRFGPFDISDYYEGDAIAIFLERNTPTGSNTNIWGVAVIGYQWTDGIRGY